jgi:hypothetical protein
MSNIHKQFATAIQHEIDVHLMDIYNISEMILDYYKEQPALTYWSEGKFIALSFRGKLMGYIPKGDIELLERVKDLTSLGWDNADRRIRLDRTSWKMKGEHLRKMIMEL